MATLKDLYDATVREYETAITHYESRLDLLKDLIDRGMGHHDIPDVAPAESTPEATSDASHPDPS